jgi:hypothetical protein
MNDIERVKIVVYPDGRLDSKNAARLSGGSPSARQTAMPTGPFLLSSVQGAEDSRRRDGGLSANYHSIRQPERHLPGL